ncbi:MAG: DUF2921 family protein [Chloroflexi bacterium]|nr:DUF2921 family protein [Chloroflexota bacterium]
MGLLGAFWGIGGVLLLLGVAVFRLTPPAIEAFSYPLQWGHWVVLIVNTAFVLYFKAFRGFQKGLSPRIAARARHLRQNPTWLRVLLAPLYCMGYFHTARRKQIATIMMTIMMVGLIVLVRFLEQPWRGIIDGGIAASLSWGFLTILGYGAQALTVAEFQFSPQLP